MRKLWISMCLAAGIVTASAAVAGDFDPVLHRKAQIYTDWLMQWHSTGLGGVSDVVFTDASRTELLRTWGSGDSGDWTGTYLATQAMRYTLTGEAEARSEVLRVAHYMHILKAITGNPGYLARYAAPDRAPWNVETLANENRYLGTGEFEGDFWLGANVRDKYITWFWGLSWAYDAVDDEAMRATIRQDFRDVILTLQKNKWVIIDPWGAVVGGAQILPDIRLSLLVQAAHVIDEPAFWTLLDSEYEAVKASLPITSIAFFNRYSDYYAFINNYSFMQPLFRLWPDEERLRHIFAIWNGNVRAWSRDGHNPFFDSVYFQASRRLRRWEPKVLQAIQKDVYQSLTQMYDPPNFQRQVTCTAMEPDPFSVVAHDFLEKNPWIGNLLGIHIDVQTKDAHEVWDRCWDSVLWERSPHHLECPPIGDDPAHTTHGVDYLIGYWVGVTYGVLPGPAYQNGDQTPE